jgi:hypothetical protein
MGEKVAAPLFQSTIGNRQSAIVNENLVFGCGRAALSF